MRLRSDLDKHLVKAIVELFSLRAFPAIKLACLFLLFAFPAMPQIPVLQTLQETVYARWDFQKEFPASVRLFSHSVSPSECAALIQKIQASQEKAISNPQSPTFADLWVDFTLGLALEKTKSGSGAANLERAAQMAKGNIGVNYELARILFQANMNKLSRSFQMETQRSMLEKGYTKIPELAKLELLYSRQAMDVGNFPVAKQHAEFASRLDPFCPWVPFLRIEMELRGASGINEKLGEVWIHLLEVFSLLRYYETQSIFALNLLRGLRVGLGIFGGVLLLALFGRYFTRISHLTVERFPQDIEIWVRHLAIALVPLSLAIGGIGYAVVALMLIVGLWKFTSFDEKSFLKIILAGLALVPLFLICERALVRYLDDTEGIHLYHQAYSRGYENPLIERMNTFVPKKTEDRLYQNLAYSLTYKKQGDYVKAGEYAKAAFNLEPQHPFTILNNGNLSMMTIDYPSAVKIFEQARNIAPQMVETWFNSSQAELYSNNSAQHKKFLDRAAEEDAVAVNQFLKNNDENFPQYPSNRKVMDPMLRNGQALATVLNSLLNFEFMKIKMRMGIYEIRGGWLIGAIALTSLLLFFRFRSYHLPAQGRDLFDCKICGRVMCRTCRKGVHCHSCFKTVSGIHDNRMKMEMIQRIRQKSTLVAVRIGTALNFLFPGSGHIYLGLGGMRFIWTLITSLTLGGLWQANHLLMEYPAYVLGPLKWMPWLPLVLLYAFFNLRLLRSPVDLAKVIPVSSPNEKAAMR
jgi:tetratricopeptide (TPR) repeat protein/TM2 domain-containing membrane protein YozV